MYIAFVIQNTRQIDIANIVLMGINGCHSLAVMDLCPFIH